MDFSIIYFDFNSFKKMAKGSIFPQELWADMARCGNRVDETWHTRPRGRAMRTHASTCVAWMWPGCVAGSREPTRMPGWRHVA